MDPGLKDGDRGTRQTYLSFLIRLWRVTVAGAPVWRVSLQRPGEAEQRAFADLDELLAFLRAETGERDGGDTVARRRGEGGEAEREAPMG